MYTYSTWYKSTATTGARVVLTSTSGAVSYINLPSVPASSVWKQASVSFNTPASTAKLSVHHYTQSIGELTTDDVSLTTQAATAPTAPTVSITAPASGASLSNSVTVTANAADATAVASVQFKINGANSGAADTTAPYSTSWDTRTVANGQYTITAVATNTSGLSTTSPAIAVTVNNQTAPAPQPAANLIANPSVEDGTATTATSWSNNSWGTNSAAFTVEPNGRTGARSLKTTVSSYSNGDAKWIHAAVPVKANGTYNYSNWYKSTVDSELDAMVTMSNGSVQFYYLTTLPASTADWAKAEVQYTVPTGAVSLTIFQVMAKAGSVQTDDFSLTEYQPARLNRPLVSLTFDDGWRSIHSNGLPLLQKYGFASTQYLNSTPVIGGYPDYMTYQMVKDFASAGHELAWHTRSHADITKLTATQLQTELSIPSAFLTGTGQPASAFRNFASPFGAYNSTSVDGVMQTYRSHRSTDVGYNSKDTLSLRNIKVQNIMNTTTPAEVQSWVNHAIATNTWLVLVYHEVSATTADPTYAVTPANLDAELNIIKQSGVAVVTVDQALTEIQSQQ
jgi:peptidoglycan/xylan/chitin deacetylase (PgdA/CDA1 family)